MKKFESLGRSLSKEQQKKVMGGDETIDDYDDGIGALCIACTSDDTCAYGRICRRSPSCTEAKVCAKPYYV